MRHGAVKEVLSRIKYDERLDESEYFIIIEHRSSEGGTKKIPVRDIQLGRGYFYVGDAQIPYHRILSVVMADGKEVWRTRKLRP